jgi:hypothetical protein
VTIMFEKIGSEFLPQVPVDEIAFAMGLFMASGNGQLPSRQPLPDAVLCGRFFLALCRKEASVLDADPAMLGTRLFATFSAVWAHYARSAWQRSVCARVLGFYFVMERSNGCALDPWTTPCADDSESVLLHPAVVQTLAATILTGDGLLRSRDFLAEVALTARGFLDLADIACAGVGSGAPAEEHSTEWTSVDVVAHR